jgi:hypothetical protein
MEEQMYMEADEWALVQILMCPVLFREFINEDDPNWLPLEQHERAWSACESHYLCMCCGRSVHKTTAMIEMLYYWMINEEFVPGDPGLFVLVPNKAQKDSIFPRIRSACETHWLVSKLVDTNAINIQEGRITFMNGFTFILRIAGTSGKESNIISVHTFRIWVDEAQDFPWRAWLSLQNVLKREIEGYKLIVSGVPNGERRENVLYICDQEDPDYNTFNVSQDKMSWWNADVEHRRRIDYHAQDVDSEDYKHYVLGQHGVPTFSVFDRVRFALEDYDVHIQNITQGMVIKSRRIDPDGVDRYHLNEVLVCPQILAEVGQSIQKGVGYDVGFSPDPAVFFIMWRDPVTGTWRNLARYILERVEYDIQREILVFLDHAYNFDFIGIDMGGPGKVQYQDLTGELNHYKDRRFDKRIHPVEFGSYVPVAKTMEIDSNGNKVEIIKKDLLKRLAVETASRWVHEHKFIFSKEDDNLMAELERTKFTRSISGEPIYKTSDDHQFAAMMCAIQAYESDFGAPLIAEKKDVIVKLIAAKWLDSQEGGYYGSK